MTDCGTVLFVDSVVILAWLIFVLVLAISIGLGYLTVNYRKNKGTDVRNDSREVRNTRQQLSKNEKRLQQQAEQLNSLQEELRQKREELREKRDIIEKLSAELEVEKVEKKDALKRLSAILSSRLRDGNPNVVDLSDQNRPVKIGEQFSELYDNQWTDAYGAVDKYFRGDMQEPDIIKLLLDILEQCFVLCKRQADKQLSHIRENVSTIATSITQKVTKFPEDLMQRIKEERKMYATDKLPDYHEVLSNVKEYCLQPHRKSDFLDDHALKVFVNECLKLCWLMVVQDPPMTMILKPAANENDKFKAYKHRGNQVVFVVWPALLLEYQGALLMKGVAEFSVRKDTP